MTTAEHTFAETETETETETPPIVVVDDKPRKAKTVEKKVEKEKEDDDDGKRTRGYSSPPLTELRRAQDGTIRDAIAAFGSSGSYKVGIKRVAPEEMRDPVTGKVVGTSGHLTTAEYTDDIDEDWLAKKYGGGRYELTFKRRNEVGKFVYAGNTHVSIAGEPNLSELPRSSVALGAQAAPAAESPSIVTKAMEMMAAQVEKADQRADRADRPLPAANPALDRMLEMMQSQLTAAMAENAAMRREMLAQRDVVAPPPPVDTYKERMLDKMIDGDSARLQAVRLQYESELRNAKENAIAEEKRIRDAFERDKLYLMQVHEREISQLRLSHESSMNAIRSSHEVQLSAIRLQADQQGKLSDSDIRRLERDNADLRVEVKELRAKKEKSVIETVKEMETIKDALGVGDGEDKSTGDKILDTVTNPEAWAAVASMFKKNQPAAAPVQQQQLQAQRPQVFRGPNGQRFVMGTHGKLEPAKRKQRPAPVQAATPEQPVESGDDAAAEAVAEAAAESVEPEVPFVEPEQLSQLVSFFESAFAAGTDPLMVAQGVRPRMPGEVLTYLRDRVTELGLARGVDTFLAKVAHLPGTSPLVAQDGRNWIRKVGGALVGE